MKNQIQKMIEKYKKRYSDSYYYNERIIYKEIMKDLKELLLMELGREKK